MESHHSAPMRSCWGVVWLRGLFWGRWGGRWLLMQVVGCRVLLLSTTNCHLVSLWRLRVWCHRLKLSCEAAARLQRWREGARRAAWRRRCCQHLVRWVRRSWSATILCGKHRCCRLRGLACSLSIMLLMLLVVDLGMLLLRLVLHEHSVLLESGRGGRGTTSGP